MANPEDRKQILSTQEIKRALYRLTHQILEKDQPSKDLVLIGIQTRGVFLANRIQKIIEEIEKVKVPVGILDITLYRDDLTAIGLKPVVKETKIDFDIGDKTVILVDDVLFTGRTIRAALDQIMDFGRPKKVELLVLIDRGHRELPIRADFVGKNIPTSKKEQVELLLEEVDGEDEAIIKEKP